MASISEKNSEASLRNVKNLSIATGPTNEERKGPSEEGEPNIGEVKTSHPDSIAQSASGTNIVNEDSGIGTPGGVFKVPKKVVKQEANKGMHPSDVSNTQTRAASSDSLSSSKLNPEVINNLNKSLKAKQKIVHSKEASKSSLPISDVMNTSPQTTVFPHNTETEGDGHQNKGQQANVNTSNINDSTSKPTNKKVSKQSSSRTDFFAAKLASAVDDVNSSDSDETFVYENSQDNFENHPQNSSNANPAGEMFIGSASGGVGSVINTSPIEDRDSGNTTTHDTLKSAVSSRAHTMRAAPSVILPNSFSMAQSNSQSRENAYGTSPTLLDTKMRPNSHRTGSSFSMPQLPLVEGEETNKTNLHRLKNEERKHSVSSFSGHYRLSGKAANTGLTSAENINIGLNRAQPQVYQNSQPPNVLSVNDESNDEHYSYDDVDTDMDDISTEDDIRSGTKNDPSSHTTLQNHKSALNNDFSDTPGNEAFHNPSQPYYGKPPSKNYKSSTSSKLRATTSKIFDKMGSQPRRYSIIPDDVDIEDFDDDLIYYDNNIHFPYNSQQNGDTISESTSLLNSMKRIPHYRSLNFAPPRRNGKSKRYLSTGQEFVPNNRDKFQGMNLNQKHPRSDIFPFPYPENKNMKSYIDKYADEQDFGISHDKQGLYDEESASKVGIAHPHLNSRNGHFLLPRKKSTKMPEKRINCIKNFIYTLISITIILSIGFVMGFVLATTKELTDVDIAAIQNPLVSQDELIFDMVVEAINPGWFTIEILNVELDIFAKSGYIPDSSDDFMSTNAVSVETVLLGTVTQLESPISFAGGFLKREIATGTTEIKLISPGRNLTNFSLQDNNGTEPDNSKKWEIISKHPFDLIIRGILKYDLPMSKGSKSVVVDKIAYIDPKFDEILGG